MHPQPDDLYGTGDLRRFAVFMACFFAVWSLAVYVVWRPGWHQGRPDAMLGSAVKFVLWLGFSVVGAYLAGAKEPFGWMGFRAITRGTIATAMLAMALFLAKDVVRLAWVEGRDVDWHAFFSGLWAAGLTGLIEESLFRGTVLTWLTTRLQPIRAIIADSALFLFAHVPGWMILQIPVTAEKLAVVALVGLICGTLRYRSGSLWPAIVAHAANNAGSRL
jgi:membrane protease YdiL (CAAX protease family)